MTSIDSAPAVREAQSLRIRNIGPSDLIDALRMGLADFNATPTHAVFLSLIYPAAGLLLFAATFRYELIPLLFPIAAGFAILGPVAAIGLYEISRLRERGQAVTWRNMLGIAHRRSVAAIFMLAGVLLALFILWLAAAYGIYASIFGETAPATLGIFVDQITTAKGMTLLVVGNLVGFAFAVLAFAISVVSFPLLIDKDADAVTAALTSVRAVAANPVMMTAWGLIVVALLVIGSLPLLMGLAVVMPILGHATWHLYRKLVV